MVEEPVKRGDIGSASIRDRRDERPAEVMDRDAVNPASAVTTVHMRDQPDNGVPTPPGEHQPVVRSPIALPTISAASGRGARVLAPALVHHAGLPPDSGGQVDMLDPHAGGLRPAAACQGDQ